MESDSVVDFMDVAVQYHTAQRLKAVDPRPSEELEREKEELLAECLRYEQLCEKELALLEEDKRRLAELKAKRNPGAYRRALALQKKNKDLTERLDTIVKAVGDAGLPVDDSAEKVWNMGDLQKGTAAVEKEVKNKKKKKRMPLIPSPIFASPM